MAEIYLNDIAHGRSGDKGDTSNVCVYARKPEYYKIIEREVTPEKLKAYFAFPAHHPGLNRRRFSRSLYLRYIRQIFFL